MSYHCIKRQQWSTISMKSLETICIIIYYCCFGMFKAQMWYNRIFRYPIWHQTFLIDLVLSNTTYDRQLKAALQTGSCFLSVFYLSNIFIISMSVQLEYKKGHEERVSKYTTFADPPEVLLAKTQSQIASNVSFYRWSIHYYTL